jgi:hypothetical protein
MTTPVNDSEKSGKNPKKFATITKDINLLSAEHAGEDVGKPCRIIEVFGPGVLVLVNADSTIVSMPSATIGHKFVGEFRGIVDTGTTATDIVVYW